MSPNLVTLPSTEFSHIPIVANNIHTLLKLGIIAKEFQITHLRITVYQGDQICRIFAHWVIVYFGQLLKN
jgi:hypothetical protein